MKAAVIMDMVGCPNRCRHCWLSHEKNAKMPVDEFIWVAEQFKGYQVNGKVFFDELIFNTWYREPDYADNYKELWEMETRLSTVPVPRFELASIWRLARDVEYAPWLKGLGVKTVQITLFGTEGNTDYFTGRKGAYRDCLKAADILIQNGIAPRIQIFPFTITLEDLPNLVPVLVKMEKQVHDMGREFACFLNTAYL